jgi:hypothetical protein
MTQSDLFDAAESRRRKAHGMAIAEDAADTLLTQAREFARSHAIYWGEVNADNVSKWLELNGLPDLGPAAGSLFRGKEWEFTGQFKQSTRKTNHARLLRVWRLR